MSVDIVEEKIGGKELGGGAGLHIGYTMSGVCAYVYRAKLRGGSSPQLALKVMINSGSEITAQIGREFEAERMLLSDRARLPPHENIMAVLHSFTDDVSGGRLPGWDFDPSIVSARTMVLVMPFYERDLKAALKSVRRAGATILPEERASRIAIHLLRAIEHLKAHGILHRDVKLDNVLLDHANTPRELAVLSDFGMCFDLRKNRVQNFRVMLPYDGFRRGGAPIAIAPEVSLPEPGPDAFLDYEKNDEWAVGIVVHQLLSEPCDLCIALLRLTSRHVC